jgi:hypothetical protein
MIHSASKVPKFPSTHKALVPSRWSPYALVTALSAFVQFSSPVSSSGAFATFNSEPVAMTWDASGNLWLLENPKPGSSSSIGVLSKQDLLQSDVSVGPRWVAANLPRVLGFEWDASGVYLGVENGIWVLTDSGPTRQVEPPQTMLILKTSTGARTVHPELFRRGADGWIYFVLNHESPSCTPQVARDWRVPERVVGGVLRFHPGLKRIEQVTQGPDKIETLLIDSRGSFFAVSRSPKSLFEIWPGARYLSHSPSNLRGPTSPGLAPAVDGSVLPPTGGQAQWARRRIEWDDRTSTQSVGAGAVTVLGPDGALWIREGNQLRWDPLFRSHSTSESNQQLARFNQTANGAGKAMEDVLERGLRDLDPLVRARALQWLRDGNAAGESVFRRLSIGLRDSDSKVQMEAWIGVFWFGPGNDLQMPPSQATLTPDRALALIQEGLQQPLQAALARKQALVWRAWEPLILNDPVAPLLSLQGLRASDESFSAWLMQESIRRVFESRSSDKVDATLAVLLQISKKNPELCAAGLEGLMRGQKASKLWTGHKGIKNLVRQLAADGNPVLADSARQVDAFCGNPKAQEAILARIGNGSLPEADRIRAIEFVSVVPSRESRQRLLEVIRTEKQPRLLSSASVVLAEIGTQAEISEVLNGWARLPASVQSHLLILISRRDELIPSLLGAMEGGRLKRSEIPAPTSAALRDHPNPKYRARAVALLQEVESH